MNFQGTLNRAIFLNNTQSLRMVLEEVLEKIDDSNYTPIMMYDLPLMLKSNQIQVNAFFNISEAERNNFEQTMRNNDSLLDPGYCNMENDFKNADLPVLGDSPFAFFQIRDFNQFMDKESDILSAIKQFNPITNVDESKDSENKDRIEVEYSYIDFTWMIIGVKIRNAMDNLPNIKFNDYYYSREMDLANGEAKLAFFGQTSIINIIDSQWKTTQDV